jgi:hypothetical protein
MWSRGRHFRIASRDSSKTTADSYISAYFEVGLPEKQEFIGQIDQIMEVNYDSVRPVLLRAKWYPNDVNERRASTTLVMDECGIQRVKANKFIEDNRVKHEPFVFPHDCNQVFLVPDRLHPEWQLVVDTEVRTSRPRLPFRMEEVTVGGQPYSSAADEEGGEGPSVDSASEGDSECSEEATHMDRNVYQEEIITYQRRKNRPQPIEVDCRTLDGQVEEELLSDDEHAPQEEDFPTIEM